MLLSSLLLTTTVQAQNHTITVNRSGVAETYQGNMETGELTINWGQNTKIFTNILGYAGQTSRVLDLFDGAPALTYRNAGSNTSFEVFYTLSLKDSAPVVNCAYFNIRNGQNGASIRKAVCNLDKPLTSEYQDLNSTYSDKWIEASNEVSLQSVMNAHSKIADVPIGRLGEINLALRYSTLDELLAASPKTIATAGMKTHQITSGNAYLVYDADGTTPMGLDVEMDSITHALKRLTPEDLLLILQAK